MSDLIEVVVLSPIRANGKRILPGTDAEPVTAQLTPEQVEDALAFESVRVVNKDAASTDAPNSDDGNKGEGGKEPEPVTTEQIADAITKLAESDYTQGGLPEVKAIEAQLGEGVNISAEQRDQGFELFKSRNAD